METDNGFIFTCTIQEILKALQASKENGTIIALTVPKLGSGIFITAIEDIIEGNEGNVYIKLKDYDVTGFMFERTTLQLTEIISVCALSHKWEGIYHRNVTANGKMLSL
jgi:hypothetical protein